MEDASNNAAPGTKFHYSRVRKRGEPAWFDPQTDIRQVLPASFIAVVTSMEEQYEGMPELEHILQLHNYIRIFQIRVVEDTTPLDKQVAEFFNALATVPGDVLTAFLSRLTSVLLCIYALFCRRDAVTDREAIQAMFEYARLSTLSEVLSTETYRKVKDELRAAVPLAVQSRTTSSDAVVCLETGDEMERVKEMASLFLSCSGKCDWNAMAEACDKAFNAATDGKSELSDKEAIALALAYPTYKHPTLTVTTDGTEDKADTPAVQ